MKKCFIEILRACTASDALSHSPAKRDIKIGRGTHLMHLEAMRLALWRESVTFLLGADVAAIPL
jgi:hypothetical protein